VREPGEGARKPLRMLRMREIQWSAGLASTRSEVA
jgi:hypothetical protein